MFEIEPFKSTIDLYKSLLDESRELNNKLSDMLARTEQSRDEFRKQAHDLSNIAQHATNLVDRLLQACKPIVEEYDDASGLSSMPVLISALHIRNLKNILEKKND
jgi:ABC-type transporter Mla subunit MlaD